jgi:hypothetical protein
MDLLTKKAGDALTIKVKIDGQVDWGDPLYRLCMANLMKKDRESPDMAYVSGMVTKLSNLGKSSVWKVNTSGTLDTMKFDGVLEDSDLKKIMAAIDMFLTRFDDHRLGFLRAETLISRYKQCMGYWTCLMLTVPFICPGVRSSGGFSWTL